MTARGTPLLRLLAASMLCIALAACVGAAPQDATDGGDVASAGTVPPGTPIRMPPKGGPNPPVRADMTCRVDADCEARPACADVECRCVRDKCLRITEPVDPVIDPVPAPATSVR